MASIDIDMAQFHEIFYEESSEGIEAMEKGLLELNTGTPDPEVINTVFRAAHSIKGASATFGFTNISEFTHVIESILDEVRERKRDVSQDLVDLLLESVDYIRHLIHSSKAGEKPDLSIKTKLIEQLNNLPKEVEKKLNPEWVISFTPNHDMLKSGNDPFRLIRQLRKLGELEAVANISKIPGPKNINPEIAYISWELILDHNVKKQDIIEIFEWVLDDCDLNISLVGERRKRVERRKDAGDVVEEVSTAVSESASIRVNINKIDNLINLVGEMVITQSMLSSYSLDDEEDNLDKLRDVIKVFETNTRDLQEQAMRIRMLPIDYTFQRLPRIVHDISRNQNKKVNLSISGNTTEVDKTVLEKLSDPLTHLLRNAIDHGIESAQERINAGKPETGNITINAYQEGGNIIIKISDDGAGLNLGKILTKAREKQLIKENEEMSESQVQHLIFMPGFSTATSVTDLSGRGVGMDVVKRNISDLGGSVDVQSEMGEGCTFIIKLPLTLAIIDGQLIKVGNQTMIVPMLNIIESVQPDKALISVLTGKKEVYHFREDYVPIIRLKEVLNNEAPETSINSTDGILILVDSGGDQVGLMVDNVMGQQQVVIKSLETNYQAIKGVSGATVLGDGTVAMIIDLPSLIEMEGISITH